MVQIEYLEKRNYSIVKETRYLNMNNINSISGIKSLIYSLDKNVSVLDKIARAKKQIEIYDSLIEKDKIVNSGTLNNSLKRHEKDEIEKLERYSNDYSSMSKFNESGEEIFEDGYLSVFYKKLRKDFNFERELIYTKKTIGNIDNINIYKKIATGISSIYDNSYMISLFYFNVEFEKGNILIMYFKSEAEATKYLNRIIGKEEQKLSDVSV